MLTVVAAMPGLALRPQHSNSASFVRLAESLSVGATDEMTFLQDASSAVNDILLQAGNATEHLTPEDQSLLESVKKIIKDDMYGSMRQAQEGDEADLAMLWNNIKECNVNIKARQSSSGDLGMIHNEARQLQIELDRLQGIVDEKTHDNDTYWNKFDLHMQMISDAPVCPDFPNPRGMAQLDIYFEMSRYSTWWTSARGPYHSSRDLFLAANEALRQAIAAYNVHQAKLIVKYCDYKVELEAACDTYEKCYASAVELYNEKVAGVKITVAKNLEIVKAAETLLAQVRFLLAQQKDRETPAYSTSEWEVTYKAVPEKTLCDMSTLTAPIWKPPIYCESITAYHLAPMGADVCDYGETPSHRDCRTAAYAAIEAHQIHSNGKYHFSAWPHLPFGCSVREGTGKTHYNHLKKGKNNGVHQLVCSGFPKWTATPIELEPENAWIN